MPVQSEDYVPFAQRPEWADVVPVPQYDGVQPLAPIFYTPEYKDATDYFRGIVKTGEMSERVLVLTEEVIRMNPAHYSAWQYRYRTLLAINASLKDELEFTKGLAIAHLKTYQVWHHRRLLLAATNDPADELRFLESVLNVDVKNYHTWSYRQWVLAHFDREEMWAGEVDYVDRLLEEDLRNNSAWHHRFFITFQRAGKDTREDVVKRELVFAKQKIALAPNNMSAWNYLRGVLDYSHTPYASQEDFVRPYTGTQVPLSFDSDVIDVENPLPSEGSRLPAVPAIEFLADIYEVEGKEGVDEAIPLWKSLAEEHDTIRKKYWEYRIHEAVTAA
ncbi:hypothetical protein K488DRAFT_68134 [Vararia minispora EC-137]|uniref:Uncharacterized protein n=1 Tax=Vararia minispora EC-137 TaxID=1314806 RepID=A0ACB8QVJ9_9AGAM|nr:hypothetical protein K488DRAFT_68134 [Vararia minispora EC-137]